MPWFSSTFIVRDIKWSFKIMLGFFCQIVYWSGHHLFNFKYIRFMYYISLMEFMKTYEEKHCCGLNVYLPTKCMYGSPNSSVTAFGVKKWLRLNEVLRMGLWFNTIDVQLRDTRSIALCTQHWGKAIWGQSKKSAVYKPGRGPSLKTKLTRTFVLDFQPPELWENKLLSSKPPSL